MTQKWKKNNETIISNDLLKCMHLCSKTHTQYCYFVLKTNIFTTQSKPKATQMDPLMSQNTQNCSHKYIHMNPQLFINGPTIPANEYPHAFKRPRTKTTCVQQCAENKRQHATVTSKWKMCVFSLVIGLCNMYLLLVACIYI